MKTVLEAKNISKVFGGLAAVTQVNFHINKGEIVSLIGPNGAGKTTFFNLITGIYEPTEGEILFHGSPLKKSKVHKITQMGIARTFQNIRLFASMTVEENIMVGRFCRTQTNLFSAIFRTNREKKQEEESKETVRSIMDFLELTDKKDHRAVDLSYGYQRRVEIARAMATNPKLLLLDEPAAGMNTQEKHAMQQLIKKIGSMGYTVLVIEHDMKLVMDISERIVVLDYGHKIAEGTPEEIQKDARVIEAYLGDGGTTCA